MDVSGRLLEHPRVRRPLLTSHRNTSLYNACYLLIHSPLIASAPIPALARPNLRHKMCVLADM